ncbi:MAG: fibronectin type III domain-containing protein [Pseudarcicella sp.]|nr:fibronectin type III domain-containing protein [Pseudarcicella sp.]
MFRNKLFQTILWLSISANNLLAQIGSETQPIQASLLINTKAGHPIPRGASGYNARIGDKIWSYKHPDFIKAFNEAKPGWLRYWSGTAGDAFCAGTGMYDKEYINMFDHGEAYDKLHDYVEIKGPHRIIDLYSLMQKTDCKLVVTVNAFTETPEMTLELANFCKNNHIKVEAWQFCNEPYFYIPGRQRYWWNDGYDYAQKMKPHAEAIQKVFPDAQLALNFTWDGVWTFMKEINQYQKEKGAFWNVFSKHSYAPHVGNEEPFEQAYKRMNSKLLEVTSPESMQEIETYTQKNIPMLITEFGVWNKTLNGIMSGIYNAEYTLRQLQHPNTWLIASHEISNKVKPKNTYQKEINAAIANHEKLNTVEMLTGTETDIEGKALQLVHEATNSSDYVYNTTLSGETKVAGLKNEEVSGMYAMAFRGTDGEDFVIITNRSDKWHQCELFANNKTIQSTFITKYLNANTLQSPDAALEIKKITVKGNIKVRPHTVMLLKWKNNRPLLPQPSKIYSIQITKEGALIKWSPQSTATSYILTIQEKNTKKITQIKIDGKHTDSFLIGKLTPKKSYTVSIQSQNDLGLSAKSSDLPFEFSKPQSPSIFKIAARDNQATIFWHSVANASAYKVKIKAKSGNYEKEYFADNVFGLKIYDLPLNTPLFATVKAVNGIGESTASAPIDFICKENIPLPPSNISAIEQNDGKINLHWNAPKITVDNINYKLFRGNEPHVFELLKDNLTSTDFIDSTIVTGKNYFYTVKSYNLNGECSFYPNIASIIRNTAQIKIQVSNISIEKDTAIITVKYANIASDGDIAFGIILSDVSYLNGEETKIFANSYNNGYFTVKIPKQTLSKATYAIKAFVQTNGGTPVISLPPHKIYQNR